MDKIFYKVAYSLIFVVFIYLAAYLMKKYSKKIQIKLNLNKSRYFIIKRIINYLANLTIVIVLILVWGIDLKNLWITITGILAMIAVSFVAVWSLIGNILAGVIIYFTSPFKIDDTIEVQPDNIRGKVLAINTFYTLLIDHNGDYYNVPNSLLLQKYIKNIKSVPIT